MPVDRNPARRVISDAPIEVREPTVDEILDRIGVPWDVDFDTAQDMVWDRRGDLHELERDVLSRAGFLPS